DWGEVSSNGKSVMYTDGDLSVTTTVMQNGSEQKLGAYNGSGNATGAGIGDGDSGGLSRGETLVVNIQGQEVNQVSFQLDGLGGYFDANSSHATQVKVTAFDANGNEIDSQGGYRESGKYADTYEFTTNVPVHHFELTTSGSDGNYVVQNMTLSKTVVDEVKFTAIAEDGTELSLTSDVNIQQGMQTTDITGLVPASDEPMTKDVKVVDTDAMQAKGALLVGGHWVVENGVEQVEPLMKDEVGGYDYPVDISAALSDVDGSESLSVTITGVPEGATLSQGTDNGDGTWTISVDDGVTSISESITISVPLDTPDFALGITATSTESSSADVNSVSDSVNISLASEAAEEVALEDTTASAPTLEMSFGEVEVVTSSSGPSINPETPKSAQGPDLENATNEGDAGRGYIKLETDNKDDSVIAGDNYDAVDLKNGDDNLKIGDSDTGWTKLDAGNGDNSVEAGDNWAELVSGSGDDNIIMGDGSRKISLGSGEDNLNAGDAGAGSAYVDSGNDDDNVTLGNEWDTIKLGSGDDTLLAGDGSTSVDLGSGNDNATLGDGGAGYASLESSSGDNTIVAGDDWDKVNLGSGDDKVQVGDNSTYINLGSGDDTLVAGDGGSGWAEVKAGEGDDNVIIGDKFDKVDLGSGNDTLNAGHGDGSYGEIQGGAGDDTITADSGWYKIDGGSGEDTVVFKGDASDWTVGEKWGNTTVTNNITGEMTFVNNVEHIEFGGKDATPGESTSYEYPVKLSAALSDTDGSETLSVVTLENIPNGCLLSGAGVVGNTVDLSQIDASNPVKLVSSEPLTNTELSNIQASVTSTEENGETNTVTAHADVEESSNIGEEIHMSNDKNESVSGTDADDTIFMGEGKSAKGQEAHGGEGDDTINVDGKDFEAYGEAGDDTFNVSSNDFKSGSSSKGSDFEGSHALIDGGEGFDTLVASGDIDIDFSALDDNISNIEAIDLGEGSQSITSLSIEDVLEVTDDDNILRIDGDEADHISLNTTAEGGSGEWSLGDFKTDSETGVGYQEYTGVADDGSNVTIEISQNIQIDES
ncbi:hypothetical protein KJ691_03585, partial [bacterium]|nr:hypothetical protein [bacterium]